MNQKIAVPPIRLTLTSRFIIVQDPRHLFPQLDDGGHVVVIVVIVVVGDSGGRDGEDGRSRRLHQHLVITVVKQVGEILVRLLLKR